MYHNFRSKNGLLGMYTYLKENKIFYFAFFQRAMYFHITTIKIKLFPFAESLKVPHPGSKLHSVHSVQIFSAIGKFSFVFKGLCVMYRPHYALFQTELGATLKMQYLAHFNSTGSFSTIFTCAFAGDQPWVGEERAVLFVPCILQEEFLNKCLTPQGLQHLSMVQPSTR